MDRPWTALRLWINEQEDAELRTGRPAPLTPAQRDAIKVLVPGVSAASSASAPKPPASASASPGPGPAPAPAPSGVFVDPDYDRVSNWVSSLNGVSFVFLLICPSPSRHLSFSNSSLAPSSSTKHSILHRSANTPRIHPAQKTPAPRVRIHPARARAPDRRQVEGRLHRPGHRGVLPERGVRLPGGPRAVVLQEDGELAPAVLPVLTSASRVPCSSRL